MSETRPIELAPVYKPQDVEARIYKFWLERGLFDSDIDKSRRPYTIVIPPPNVTGILHMGHALNNTYQDILIRYYRMAGRNALWMPGTDHAGIATQNVVEKKIAKQGLRRQDLGREKFLAEVWQWKEEYGSTIVNQLKRLGASCDWRRLRFTMDTEYSKAVRFAFVHLFKRGLIYQGNYIINWCPRCHTALADEEAPKIETKGALYHIRYPLSGGKGYVVVATTRPETMLGDTAVAVNPKDKRYKDLIGRSAVLPILNRELPIIADEFVDLEFGTGAVKITPAHDPNDFFAGKRHNLEEVVVMNPDGTMNENAGPYKGLDRFECRKRIIERLKQEGLLEKVEEHVHNVGHCYRCDTVIEPYLSRQWFVKMQPLAEPAIRAAKEGKVRFVPQRWTKVYLNWMENIQDWCISRQIWWGHRIPVWYCVDEDGSRTDCPPICEMQDPEKCPRCGNKRLAQDEDVLDTWFSSWLWPFATFYWPSEEKKVKAELSYYYPTNTLITAPEILFFWVARMIMAGMEFMGKVPFDTVYLHGTVRDDTGRKMSKSLGNIIDPLEVIQEMGADALRFSLISITATGQDVYLSRSKFELGRNFTNKIWNAFRFLNNFVSERQGNTLSALLNARIEESELTIYDRWIISAFSRTAASINSAIEDFRFNEAANILYSFFWDQYCDWYIEFAKTEPGSQTPAVLIKVFEGFLKLLHPFMPFISEELWQKFAAKDTHQSIMTQPLPSPEIDGIGVDEGAEKDMAVICEVISKIRSFRFDFKVASSVRQKVFIEASERIKALLLDNKKAVCRLAFSDDIIPAQEGVDYTKGYAAITLPYATVYLGLGGIIDLEKERQRIDGEIKALSVQIKKKEGLLSNKAFLSKAPEHVVQKERSALEDLVKNLERLKGLRDAISSA